MSDDPTGVSAKGDRSVSAHDLSGIVVTGDHAIIQTPGVGPTFGLEAAGKRISYPPGNVPYVRANITSSDIYNRLQANNACIVSGPSGIGKSRLTAEFCRQNANEYGFIIWLDGSTKNSFALSLTQALDAVPQSQVDLASTFNMLLARTRTRGLVVVDNATDDSSEQIAQITANLGIHQLVVNTQAWSPGSLRLQTLGANEAVLLWLGETMNLSDEEARQVVQFSGGLPIALLAVAQAVGDRVLDIEEYSDVEKSILPASQEPEIAAAVSAINVNLRFLQRGWADARKVLAVLAAGAPAPMTLKLLCNASGLRLSRRQAERIASWTGGTFDASNESIATHSFMQSSIEKVINRDEIERARAALANAIVRVSHELEYSIPHAMALNLPAPFTALAGTAINHGLNRLARWLSERALELSRANLRQDRWTIQHAELRHAQVLVAAGYLLDAKYLASESLRKLDLISHSDSENDKALIRSALLHVIGNSQQASLLDEPQQTSREAMYALHSACLWHLRAHAGPCDVVNGYADDFCTMAQETLMITLLDYYKTGASLMTPPPRKSHVMMSPEIAVKQVEDLLRPLVASGLNTRLVRIRRFMKSYQKAYEDIVQYLENGTSHRSFSLQATLEPLMRGGRRRNDKEPELGATSPCAVACNDAERVLESLKLKWQSDRPSPSFELIDTLEKLDAALSLRTAAENYEDRVMAARVTEIATRATLGVVDLHNISDQVLTLAQCVLRVMGRVNATTIAYRESGEAYGNLNPVLAAAFRCLLVTRQRDSAIQLLEMLAHRIFDSRQMGEFGVRCGVCASIFASESVDLSTPQTWTYIAESLDIDPGSSTYGILNFLEVLGRVSDATRRQESGLVPVDPISRNDIMDAIRGMNLEGPRPVLVRDLLHSYGHLNGYDSKESKWAHRACVLLSLKYGPGADELAFERHCLGHVYEEQRDLERALEEYDNALTLLRSLYGDRHYLDAELSTHVSVISEYLLD